MPGVLLKPPRSRQPPLGAQIDWGHPLARGLAFANLAPNPSDLVRPRAVTARSAGLTVGRSQAGVGWQNGAIAYGGPILDGSKPMTVVARLTAPATQINGLVVFSAGGASTGWKAGRQYNNSANGVFSFIGTNDYVITNQFAGAGAKSLDVAWASTGNGGTVTGYTNGVVMGAPVALGSMTATTQSLALGGDTSGTGSLWQGNIAFCFAWARALTPGEIWAFYQNPFQFLVTAAPTPRYWVQGASSTNASITAASAQFRFWSLRPPTVSGTASITGASAQLRLWAPAPAILTTGAALTAASAQLRLWSLKPSTVSGSASITAGSAQLRLWSLKPPAVSTTSGVSLTAASAQLRLWSLKPPTVTATFSNSITARPAQLRFWSLQPPTVFAGIVGTPPRICDPTSAKVVAYTSSAAVSAYTSKAALVAYSSTAKVTVYQSFATVVPYTSTATTKSCSGGT